MMLRAEYLDKTTKTRKLNNNYTIKEHLNLFFFGIALKRLKKCEISRGFSYSTVSIYREPI